MKDKTEHMSWSEVKSRIDSAIDRINEGQNLSGPERLRILRARTRELAISKQAEELRKESVELVLFRLADETYGIEIKQVAEVYPLKDVTPLPCTPSYVVGLINIRGEIKTLIDIRKFFELPEKGLSERSRVILAQAHAAEVGILADDVLGISSLPQDTIQELLPTMTDKRAEYTKGVSTGQIIILDIEKILSDEKIIVNESMI